MRIFCLTVVALLCINNVNFAQVMQNSNSGNVDWEKRVIVVTGMGAPNKEMDPVTWSISARRAAEMDALSRIVAVTQGILIDASTTVENFIVTHNVVKGQLRGVVSNFTIEETRDLPSGAVEVDVSVPLDGKLSNLFFPGDGVQKVSKKSGVFTGLIVNAKGHGVTPSMWPKIIDDNDELVYGTGLVSKEYAVNQGIVGYTKSIDSAKSNINRIGDNPLIITAVGSSGSRKTDVVIANSEAMKIKNLDTNLRFMQLCKVILVVD